MKLDGGVQIVGEALDDATPLGVLLPLDDAWTIRLAAADRLRRKIAGLPVTAPLTRHRRERLKRALRTIDGRRAGASYRALATVLFGARRVSAEHWKTGSLKAQAARLAAYGRMLIDRGYRRLLRAGSGRRSK